MQIQRIYNNLEKHIKANKVLVIYGARQVGKTTLIKNFLQNTNLKYKLDFGENLSIHEILGGNNFEKTIEYAKNYELVVIDEAQKIKNIGEGLKIIVDHIENIKVIVTGSSSFELAGQIGEPLTGRKINLTLFPVSQIELNNLYNKVELSQNLEKYLIFGSYPEVLINDDKFEKEKILNEIVGSYLLKDIFALEKVKSPKLVLDLLRLLAFQVGSEVSFTELGNRLEIDNKTVARYIDLFEKAFVIYNLRGYSANLRKEITKKGKYYFYDNGIRNAIISNFNELALRNDIGQLWENFILIERLKKKYYHNIYANNFFWRTWDGKEIDLIEEREGKLFGYEFKWQKNNFKKPQEFLDTYKNSSIELINKENYLDFVL